MKNFRRNNKNSGYALYFAIILTGLLILVSYITANISIKELSLSSSAADSHIAFANADTGLECALYWDLKNSGGISAFDPTTPGSITCNNQTITTGSQTVQTTPTQSSIVGGTGSAAPVALIDVGGPYTDTLGQNWSADNSFSGGTVFSTSNAISGTSDQPLYQSERYGNFSYIISGLTPNSSYTVLLKFAELFWSTPGSRVFNVIINGSTALSNFDIVADAGGNFKADDKSFATTADGSGTITIQFVTVTDNAKIDSIEITGNGAGGSSIFQLNFSQGCAIVKVTKSPGSTLIESRGYNVCSGSRRLERGVKIQY